MKTKAQFAIEFVALSSIMLTVFVGFFAIVTYRLHEIEEQEIEEEIDVILTKIKNEVELANIAHEGYNRTFYIPKKIRGNNYSIIVIQDTEVLIKVGDHEQIIFLPPNAFGKLNKGYNYVSKRKENIYLGNLEDPECDNDKDDDNDNLVDEDDPGCFESCEYLNYLKYRMDSPELDFCNCGSVGECCASPGFGFEYTLFDSDCPGETCWQSCTPLGVVFFTIKSSFGDVLTIDDYGNAVLMGDLYWNANPITTADDEFILKNDAGQYAMVINLVTGNMIISGELFEYVTDFGPYINGGGDIVITDEDDEIVAVLTSDGDFVLRGLLTVTNKYECDNGIPEGIEDCDICCQDNCVTGCPACFVDADCDDGTWCNGDEVCNSGTCGAGTAPDCDDLVDCTDDSCNEGTDSCDNVPNDANCGGGDTCDPVLGCVEPYCDNANMNDNVLMLHMNDNSGWGWNKYTSDSSGNNNDGSISGATFDANGKFDYTYDFDGNNDRIVVDDDSTLDITGPITISAWVYPEDTTAENDRVISKAWASEQSPWDVYSIHRIGGSQRYDFCVGCSDGTYNCSSTASTANLNEWTNIVGVYDDNSVKIYFNGNLQGQNPLSCTIEENARDLNIGRYYYDEAYFNGKIDDVAIWDRALIPSEVKKIAVGEELCGSGEDQCGDGDPQLAYEECDDGNADNSDDCLANCSNNVCGDGYEYVGVEECDDGNNVDGDGCDSNCKDEILYCDNVNSIGNVLLMHMDDDGGTTSDSSGNNNHGDVNGAAFVSNGYFNDAYDFDADADYVNVGNDPDLTDMTTATVCAWVNPRGWGDGNFGRIYDKGSAFAFYIDNNGDAPDEALAFLVSHDTTNLNVKSAAGTIELNQWQHVCTVWTGDQASSSVTLYINGIEPSYGTQTSGDGSRDSDSSWDGLIGNRDTDLSRSFDGIIDEIAIWNRSLSSAEIKYMHAKGILCNFDALRCGDGVEQLAYEECDDGDVDNNDNCLRNCTLNICGDGIRISDPDCGTRGDCEECDDGNLVSGDGCSNSCTVESGYECNGEPSVCEETCARLGSQLVLLMHLDGNFDDSADSPNDNTGQCGSDCPTPTTGKIGGAYSFDGNNDFVWGQDDDFRTGDGPRTIALWAIIDSRPSDEEAFFFGYGTTSTNEAYQFGIENRNGVGSGQLHFTQWGGGHMSDSVASTGGNWRHYALVYDGWDANYKYYINGGLVGTRNMGALSTSLNSYGLGGRQDGSTGGQHIDAKIDEVAVWNRALSEADIDLIVEKHDICDP